MNVFSPGLQMVVLVPTRGRPANVARLAAACDETCTASTRVIFAVDLDDPTRGTAAAAVARSRRSVLCAGPPLSMARWTNYLTRSWDWVPVIVSMGDDHVPVTRGWDTELLGAIHRMGGAGIAYPNDRRRTDVCEVAAVSSVIVKALGWMCEPTLAHYWVDNVWHDLGEGAGCLAYLPEVIVEHRHPATGLAASDPTYTTAEHTHGKDDAAAYRAWRAKRMATDIARVRAAVERERERRGHTTVG